MAACPKFYVDCRLCQEDFTLPRISIFMLYGHLYLPFSTYLFIEANIAPFCSYLCTPVNTTLFGRWKPLWRLKAPTFELHFSCLPMLCTILYLFIYFSYPDICEIRNKRLKLLPMNSKDNARQIIGTLKVQYTVGGMYWAHGGTYQSEVSLTVFCIFKCAYSLIENVKKKGRVWKSSVLSSWRHLSIRSLSDCVLYF